MKTRSLIQSPAILDPIPRAIADGKALIGIPPPIKTKDDAIPPTPAWTANTDPFNIWLFIPIFLKTNSDVKSDTTEPIAQPVAFAKTVGTVIPKYSTLSSTGIQTRY